MKIHNPSVLILCSLACLAALSIGGLFPADQWYQDINRAPWSPPNIAFPIVWTILYGLIAISGWQLFSRPESTPLLTRLWVIQLLLNGVWSWIFFGQHWVTIALIDIIVIAVLVAWIIVAAWRRQIRSVSYMMTPYLVWLSLATSLNVYIVVMN